MLTKNSLLLAVMPLIVNGALPPLVKVIDCGALELPASWPPKLKLGDDRDRTAPEPVPVSDTVWGLPVALSVTDKLPLAGKVVLGVKVTLIAQLAPAPTGLAVLQRFVPVVPTVKLALAAILLIVSVAVPVFVSMTTCGALVVPTG